MLNEPLEKKTSYLKKRKPYCKTNNKSSCHQKNLKRDEKKETDTKKE
jgi:hypothetical protein